MNWDIYKIVCSSICLSFKNFILSVHIEVIRSSVLIILKNNLKSRISFILMIVYFNF